MVIVSDSPPKSEEILKLIHTNRLVEFVQDMAQIGIYLFSNICIGQDPCWWSAGIPASWCSWTFRMSFSWLALFTHIRQAHQGRNEVLADISSYKIDNGFLHEHSQSLFDYQFWGSQLSCHEAALSRSPHKRVGKVFFGRLPVT